MRTLLLLRHAKSSWGDASLPDHERPLNKRGRKAANSVGEFMAARGLLPDKVLVSSARRAQQTAALWSKAAGYRGEIETHADLYLAEPATYLEHLRMLDDSLAHVMCVGHNPGLENLVHQLTGAAEALPTAALAELRFRESCWQDIKGANAELVNVWRVKELPD